MTPSIAIRTQGLSRRFGRLIAVDGLDLEIRAGEVFGVLGHNGAGKTTTVRLLNGVLTPSGGSAQVLGFGSRDAGRGAARPYRCAHRNFRPSKSA